MKPQIKRLLWNVIAKNSAQITTFNKREIENFSATPNKKKKKKKKKQKKTKGTKQGSDKHFRFHLMSKGDKYSGVRILNTHELSLVHPFFEARPVDGGIGSDGSYWREDALCCALYISSKSLIAALIIPRFCTFISTFI